MLSFDIRSLTSHAATVSGELQPSDPIWEGVEVAPASPVIVSGRVSSAGGGRYYWSGRIEGSVSMECSRCVEPVDVKVAEDVRALFAEEGTEGNDDPDVYTLERGSTILNLRTAIREHWLLSAPRFALCRVDCKGLCPQCGENWNNAQCTCAPARDSRWDALRRANLK